MPFSPRPTRRPPYLHLFSTLAAAVLVCLAACRPPQPPDQRRTVPNDRTQSVQSAPAGTAAAALEGLWFQLQEGRFEEIPGAGHIRPVRLRPWTVQERIADLAELDGRLFLAVNGYGVAQLGPGPADYPNFRPFYDPLLFDHRTFTRLLPGARSLLCHVYFNSLLNEVGPEALSLRGISLLELFPSDGVYRHRTPPFQRRNPEWECVGFVPENPASALLAWKLSNAEETRFSYTRLELGAGRETPADQQAYRSAFAFKPIGNRADPGLKAVVREAVRRLDSPSLVTGIQFVVRSEGSALRRRYQVLPPEFQVSADITLLSLPVAHRGGRYMLLTPGGLLLWAREGSAAAEEHRLPGLPPGFAYTDMLLSAGQLLASWEQKAFTDVGAAGLLLIRDADLSP